MEIRPATADDWPAIWSIVRAVVMDGTTYTTPADIAEDAARTLWTATPGWRTVVAVDDTGQVAGVAKYGPNFPGRGSHVANGSFMVDPNGQARGVGRALGEHVVAAARADGFAAMQFNAVVETNTRAVALWEHLGFRVMTTIPEAFDHPTHGRVGLHIMHRPL